MRTDYGWRDVVETAQAVLEKAHRKSLWSLGNNVKCRSLYDETTCDGLLGFILMLLISALKDRALFEWFGTIIYSVHVNFVFWTDFNAY